MPKSDSQEYVKRINSAVSFLEEMRTPAQAVNAMMKEYFLSRRQAYRYIMKAKVLRKPLSIPDKKIVFTVKLSPDTINAVRQFSRIQQRTISDVVNEALVYYLKKGLQSGSSCE